MDIRNTYDAVARRYAQDLGDELTRKPLARAMLDAFAASVPEGPVVDLGCGPGHVSAYLAARGLPVAGLDLSPEMVAVAQERHSGISFTVGDMTQLPHASGALAGVVALYSVIHLEPGPREQAYREMARVLAPGGLLLIAFHVETTEHRTGSAIHLDSWFDQAVDLDAFFLDPQEELTRLGAAGLTPRAFLDRAPEEGEYPSRRAVLMLRR